MRHLYSFLTRLLRPVAFAGVLWRGWGNRAYWDGLGERFGWGARLAGASIWVHAVSLGEVTAAAPLVRALCARHPEFRVLVTTATPTGRARARMLFGDVADVRFLPYDTPGAMRRFLSRVRPRVAVIMETELWPNLFHECRRRGVAVVLANARLSARSVARYRRFGALFREVFAGRVLVAAQSEADAARFIAIGAPPDRTWVVGNLKFDVVVEAAVLGRGRQLRSSFGAARPVWIAGSTHAGEDEAVLTAHAAVCARLPDALLLLVPRHPARFDAVAELLRVRGLSFARRSRPGAVDGAVGVARGVVVEVLLGDTMGELASLYGAADVAFVGGSLVPVGGHNLIEPAALGIPVLAGPYQSNARDVAQRLEQAGALLLVADAAQLGATVSELLADAARRRRLGAAGLAVVEENRGSLGRLLELIEPPLAAADRSPEAAPAAAS
jgi:3-deoxy-D-manno-octulosonic-acid transferase